MARSSETIINWRLPVGLVAQAMINAAHSIMLRYRFLKSTPLDSIELQTLCGCP